MDGCNCDAVASFAVDGSDAGTVSEVRGRSWGASGVRIQWPAGKAIFVGQENPVADMVWGVVG